MRIEPTAANRVQPPGSVPRGRPDPPAASGRTSFQHVLRSALDDGRELKLSGHAQQRLESRGIRLDDTQLARLGDAVGRAAAKAANRSLVLLDEMAFIVSVPTRTVITAMDDPREGVFTNIDSAVIG
jgi:flagellar operon protein